MIVLNSPADRSLSARGHGAYPRRIVWTTIAVAALSSACTGGAREEMERNSSKPTSVEQRRAVMEQESTPNSPQRAPNTQADEGKGEVPPQLLALFKDDLARRALVKAQDITVLSATEKQWPDGSMGCPQPDHVYTQAVIPGYRVLLQASGETYAYHSDQRGHFIVCAGGKALSPAKQQMQSPPPAE